MKMIDRLRAHKKVARVDIDPDGIFVELKQGWSFDPAPGQPGGVRGYSHESIGGADLRDALLRALYRLTTKPPMEARMIDVSNDAYLARMAIVEACAFISAAHVRMRPRIFQDGTMWCCLYGENLQEGIAGFGETAEAACAAFDQAWSCERTPAAMFAAKNAA